MWSEDNPVEESSRPRELVGETPVLENAKEDALRGPG